MKSRKPNLRFPFASIWERYFAKETLKVFCLFLACFYTLYMLIDFSTQFSKFHRNHIQIRWTEIATYYGCDFIKRLDTLAPFALLIATIRSLTSFNTNNELVALLAGGIKLKTLLRPFLLLSLACVALVYANEEFLLPGALETIKKIEYERSLHKTKNSNIKGIQHVVLEDLSPMLFLEYDNAKGTLFDVYWIRSIDEVYRFKFLHPYQEPPVGEFVDHFVRNSKGQFIQERSYAKRLFPEIRFNPSSLLDTLTQPEELSVSDLYHSLPSNRSSMSEKESESLTIFYYKLLIPWFCLLAFFIPTPYCVQFTRQLPVFMIYAGSLFGMVALYLIFDSAVVLGKRQALTPDLALGIPFSLFFSFFTVRYLRNI